MFASLAIGCTDAADVGNVRADHSNNELSAFASTYLADEKYGVVGIVATNSAPKKQSVLLQRFEVHPLTEDCRNAIAKMNDLEGFSSVHSELQRIRDIEPGAWDSWLLPVPKTLLDRGCSLGVELRHARITTPRDDPRTTSLSIPLKTGTFHSLPEAMNTTSAPEEMFVRHAIVPAPVPVLRSHILVRASNGASDVSVVKGLLECASGEVRQSSGDYMIAPGALAKLNAAMAAAGQWLILYQVFPGDPAVADPRSCSAVYEVRVRAAGRSERTSMTQGTFRDAPVLTE